jgi:hypothetical protein
VPKMVVDPHVATHTRTFQTTHLRMSTELNMQINGGASIAASITCLSPRRKWTHANGDQASTQLLAPRSSMSKSNPPRLLWGWRHMNRRRGPRLRRRPQGPPVQYAPPAGLAASAVAGGGGGQGNAGCGPCLLLPT